MSLYTNAERARRVRAGITTPPVLPVVVSDPCSLAWAAGIIDGEGCIRLAHNESKSFNVTVHVTNTDLRMLNRLREIFGFGGINPLTKYPGTRRPAFAWSAHSLKAEAVLRAILPYLINKREQADLALQARSLQGRRGPRTPNPHNGELASIAARLVEMKKPERPTLA